MLPERMRTCRRRIARLSKAGADVLPPCRMHSQSAAGAARAGICRTARLRAFVRRPNRSSCPVRLAPAWRRRATKSASSASNSVDMATSRGRPGMPTALWTWFQRWQASVERSFRDCLSEPRTRRREGCGRCGTLPVPFRVCSIKATRVRSGRQTTIDLAAPSSTMLPSTAKPWVNFRPLAETGGSCPGSART